MDSFTVPIGQIAPWAAQPVPPTLHIDYSSWDVFTKKKQLSQNNEKKKFNGQCQLEKDLSEDLNTNNLNNILDANIAY